MNPNFTLQDLMRAFLALEGTPNYSYLKNFGTIRQFNINKEKSNEYSIRLREGSAIAYIYNTSKEEIIQAYCEFFKILRKITLR